MYYLGRAQAALGHDLGIYSVSDKPSIPVPGCEVKSYPVRRLPWWLPGRRLQRAYNRSPLNLPVALTTDLIAWHPSIVHFHVIHVSQAIRLARRLRRDHIPYCVSIHGGLSVVAQRRRRIGKAIFRFLFERAYLNDAAFIHAVSAADVEGLKAYGAHNRVVVAPNCIDPSLLPLDADRTLAHRRMPEIKGKRLFLYVGRLSPEEKGLDMLLTAWAGMPSRDGLALVLVGPDWRGGKARLQGLVDALGIADSVRFFGAVSGREKWDLLAGSDVFVHPSRSEGSPFAVLEAMLASKPVLLTEPADADGFVARAGAGVVVSANQESIGKALSLLAAADKSELDRFGLAARDLVLNHFSWESTTRKLLDAYAVASGGR